MRKFCPNAAVCPALPTVNAQVNKVDATINYLYLGRVIFEGSNTNQGLSDTCDLAQLYNIRREIVELYSLIL